MLHFNFRNKGFRGFTLIELLVVIAIIGLLGTIISGPINSARNKAKDAKKIGDIKNIQAALAQYADTNGQFPLTLGALSPQYIDAVPRNTLAAYTPQMDKYIYIIYDTDPAAATTLYTGYHLLTKLSVTGNPALDTDADCGGNNCSVAAVSSVSVTNWTSAADPGAPANATTDVTAANTTDTSASICSAGAANSCVFDVRGNI